MSKPDWEFIKSKIDEHDYMSGIERTISRVAATAEVFTPSALVVEILQYLDPDIYGPGKTVIDPACGDGQFLVGAKWAKIVIHGMSEADALQDLYGVDIMRDNVDICRRRLGGGTVLLGNTLNPSEKVQGQTKQEHLSMIDLFGDRSNGLSAIESETPTLF
jgi:hypothetical protein